MPFDLEIDWALDGDRLIGRVTPGPQHKGPEGHLHGGIAALCLDECLASLGQALDGVATVTATLSLRYRRPIPLDGRELRMEAWRDGPARRATRVRGHLLDADGRPAVEASGLFVRVQGLSGASSGVNSAHQRRITPLSAPEERVSGD